MIKEKSTLATMEDMLSLQSESLNSVSFCLTQLSALFQQLMRSAIRLLESDREKACFAGKGEGDRYLLGC